MSYQFQLRKMYSFQVHASSVLGVGNFQKVTVLSVMDFDTAMQFADIPAMHENVFSFLPSGTPDRPEDYEYLLIKTAAGKTVIGVPWIDESTIEQVSSMKIQAVIDDVSTADIERIRACLTQNGYHNIDLKIVS